MADNPINYLYSKFIIFVYVKHKDSFKYTGQCTCNVTWWCIRVAIVAVETPNSVYLCFFFLSYISLSAL
jgi:hypothetical protein